MNKLKNGWFLWCSLDRYLNPHDAQKTSQQLFALPWPIKKHSLLTGNFKKMGNKKNRETTLWQYQGKSSKTRPLTLTHY